MTEYLSQQVLYQDGSSSANLDSNYMPMQIFDSMIQEIDKVIFAPDQDYNTFGITQIEYDKGNLINTITGIDTGAYSYTQYYKMRGFNSGTNSYENWTSSNLPNLNPPSGNTLTDIVIVSIWFA